MQKRRLFPISLLLFLAGCGVDEVPVCNSPSVTNLLVSGSLEKLKEVESARYSQMPDYARDRDLEAKLKALSGKVANIRQTNYDTKNNIRSCSGDYEYSEDLQLVWTLSARMKGIALCEKAFTYKIEKTLDKPGGFYVSWVCSR